MIRSALARRQLSIITNSCMMFSFTGGQVGWIKNTSRPRMSSLILHEISPSGNVPSDTSPSGTPRYSAIRVASAGLALPLKIFRSFITRGEEPGFRGQGKSVARGQ